ncbi:hypothetical protein MFIFM68171_04893 [Madurella fahalii]|uniref:RNase T2-like C-terminal domain-containing protein n=1 Tax=Madurella fahalii TaxID=1157608 RepID=A0ABQ0GA88_9PEZI
MHLSRLLASLLSAPALVASAPAPAPAPTSAVDLVDLRTKAFSGIGQLRTRWNEGDYADLGCLTDTGLWTSNDALCGTFRADQRDSFGLAVFTLTSAAGPCRIYGGSFHCEKGNEAHEFGIWPFPNSIPGVDCLRYGKYGLMATWGKSPPSPADPPQELHMVSYAEKGKYVWLTWAPLRKGGPKDGSD